MKPLSAGARAAYAAGSFGTGVFSTVPTVLLLFFCTETLKIPPGWAAIAVFVPKIWAIVWDPFVGAWSDRTKSRFGRRRPFLVAGTIGVAVSFVALFSPPPLSVEASFVWISLAYFALATLYSLFAVPYIALPAEIGATPQARASLVAWRMLVAMIGVLAGAGLAPVLVEQAGGGRNGYASMSLLVAAGCALAMSLPLWMLRGRDRAAAGTQQKQQLTQQMRRALSNGPFRRLALAYLLQLTGVGALTSSVPYLVTGLFARSAGETGTAMGVLLLATTITVPAWSWLGTRIGERRALATAILGFAVTVALLGVVAQSGANWNAALAAFALAGIPFAGLQVLPFTLVAHLAHEESQRTGRAEEGVFTGVWTATEKLGLALGPALTGIALALVHTADMGIALFVTIVPALLALLSLPCIAARRAELLHV